MQLMKRNCPFIVFLLFLSLIPAAFGAAANLEVSQFELITRGRMANPGPFSLSSVGNFALNIEGGSKFSGDLGFRFVGENLEHPLPTDSMTLSFDHASATIRDIFGIPADLTYFVGWNDNFCSGEEFPRLFGTRPIMTDFRGYFYFPDGQLYDGIHQIKGTGLRLSTQLGTEDLAFFWYGYQDNHISAGQYSSDLRFLLNSKVIKMEATLGGTWPNSTYGTYRGGFLFHISADERGSFLAQVGLPHWDPAQPLSQELFYFLIEPRIHFGAFSIIPTLFRHPAYYNHAETGEASSTDINFNFRLGDLSESGFTGGLETFFNVNSKTDSSGLTDQFSTRISPYISFLEGGSIWSVKFNFQVFPYSLPELFELFLGVKAQY